MYVKRVHRIFVCTYELKKSYAYDRTATSKRYLSILPYLNWGKNDGKCNL